MDAGAAEEKMIEKRTKSIIERVVMSHRDGHKIEPCNISAGFDDDSQEIISVGLRYKLSRRPIDPVKTLAMQSAIRDALIKAGDLRTLLFYPLHNQSSGSAAQNLCLGESVRMGMIPIQARRLVPGDPDTIFKCRI